MTYMQTAELKLLVVNELKSKLIWSQMSFLGSFNTLVGILYGPVALLILRKVSGKRN